MTNSNSIGKRIIAGVIAFITAVFATGLLWGCSFIGKVENVSFSVSQLILRIGESRDISEVMVTECTSYIVTSSDSSIVQVSGTVATAKSEGTAYVKVTYKDGSASLRVVCRNTKSLSISYSGNLIQTVGQNTAVVVTPTCSGLDGQIVWSVNGEVQSTGGLDGAFSFTPTGAGAFVIKAEADGLSETITVLSYHRVSATCEYSGEVNQSAPFTAIRISVNVESNPQNPPDFIEFLVDNEVVQSGKSNVYSYMPTAGTHYISVRVNGIQCRISGETSLAVRCVGSVEPAAPTLEFNNSYPHIYIKYELIGAAQVRIIAPDGTATEYSQNNALYADKFEQGSFDAGEFINLCASGRSGVYKIAVKSLGDGDAILESEYSPNLEFEQLPGLAEQYLKTMNGNFDMYAVDMLEIATIFEYGTTFYVKKANVKATFSCYMAFDYTSSGDFLSAAMATLHLFSGTIAVDQDGNILTFVVTKKHEPYPTQTTQTVDTVQDHGILPHINFNPEKNRPTDYAFPVDSIADTMYVTTSDQLMFALENGCRPIPVPDSAAETVYGIARDILRQICTDDMTDLQKAHAVYDWIMWNTTYDSASDENVHSARYYAEGVFGDGKTVIGNMVYYPNAVCDGICKAYAIMCNIEGIPCYTVTGDAYSGGSYDGHAWNKVYVDDKWYFVDATWGDFTYADSTSTAHDTGSHTYLFLTDEQVAETHFEHYDLGTCDLYFRPRTTNERFDIYSQMPIGDAVIDCTVTSNDNLSLRVSEIVTAVMEEYVQHYKDITSVYIPGGINDGNYSYEKFGFELKFSSGVDSLATHSIVNNIVKKYGAKADILDFNNIMIVYVE